MAGYLRKYATPDGYRVRAEYDLDTKDYPRDHNGNINSSFDDLYIDCAGGSKITHYGKKILTAYIPSIGRGHNNVKQLYQEVVDEDLSKFETTIREIDVFDEKGNKIGTNVKENPLFNYELLYSTLKEKEIVYYINDTDSEVEFRFHDKNTHIVAKILKAKTSGSKISPFSTKNLPKAKYTIPEEDNKAFKVLVEEIPLSSINTMYSEFAKKYKIDLNAARKKAMLDNKKYIHSLGKWNELLKFIDRYKNQFTS